MKSVRSLHGALRSVPALPVRVLQDRERVAAGVDERVDAGLPQLRLALAGGLARKSIRAPAA